MAKAKKEFKAGDKVIWFKAGGFSGREPVIAWVTQECFYPCDMESRVRVTRHEKDALEGLGILDSKDYVWPWDDLFWTHCKGWLNQKAQLGANLNKLQKGKF